MIESKIISKKDRGSFIFQFQPMELRTSETIFPISYADDYKKIICVSTRVFKKMKVVSTSSIKHKRDKDGFIEQPIVVRKIPLPVDKESNTKEYFNKNKEKISEIITKYKQSNE